MTARTHCTVKRSLDKVAAFGWQLNHTFLRRRTLLSLALQQHTDYSFDLMLEEYASPVDVALVVVIQAWPYLPEAIRKGILAMVRAAAVQ